MLAALTLARVGRSLGLDQPVAASQSASAPPTQAGRPCPLKHVGCSLSVALAPTSLLASQANCEQQLLLYVHRSRWPHPPRTGTATLILKCHSRQVQGVRTAHRRKACTLLGLTVLPPEHPLTPSAPPAPRTPPGFSDCTACVSTAARSISTSVPPRGAITHTKGRPLEPPATGPLSSSGTASTRRRLVSPRVLPSTIGAVTPPATSVTCRAFHSR
jgi:hypothetical protein